MDLTGQIIHNGKHVFDVLTVNYESIIYVPYNGEDNLTKYLDYRPNSRLTEIVLGLFLGKEKKIKTGLFGDIILYENDRNHLWEETRQEIVIEKLKKESVYYVFFRAFVKGILHYYKLKFAADIIEGKLVGIVAALIDNGIIEKINRSRELELYQAIDNAERAIIEKTAELRERTLSLSYANGEAIELLGTIVESRNKESGLHIKRVKTFTKVLAEQLMENYPEYGLSSETINNIVSASSLHDIGKIKVPDAILLKQDRLTPEEIKEMQKHCEYGLDILRLAPKSWTPQYIKTALDICGCHHEKWDGKGYPNGLKGDQIPISAQIVSVADCYDALTTERVYKSAYSPEESFNMILNGECGAFSEKILACLTLCKDKFAKIAENPDYFREKVLVQLSGENKLKGLKILLVDDSEINLDINSDILENEGASITTAENGAKAIEKFTNEGPFDVVIMDIVMPEMNGIEATRRIREIESNLGNRVPIIALSAEGVSNTILLEAGIDASMAKPLVVGELTRLLISCMHNSSIQMKKQLAETLKIANTDALTKVKNIAAYTDLQASLNNEILEKGDLEFAIVVCDINDLKYANDTFGHETGNMYIKNCSKILCDVFSGSPVYRVGGDEFVVVLQGADYAQRKKSLQLLKERIIEAETIGEYMNGKASFAVGISEYNPMTDSSVHDVQGRADTAMYLDKKTKKKVLENEIN